MNMNHISSIEWFKFALTCKADGNEIMKNEGEKKNCRNLRWILL